MREVTRELRQFVRSVPFHTWAATLLLTSVLVFVNYRFGLDRYLMRLETAPRLVAWYALFIVAFGSAFLFQRPALALRKEFFLLFFLAPAIFSLKLALPLKLAFIADETVRDYWQRLLYFPYKLALVVALLLVLRSCLRLREPLWGTAAARSSLRPYLGMLLFMTPLVLLAATRPDFQALYPKWNHIASVRVASGWQKLVYELAYGSDFITIELFFRGFLVLAFARYVGMAAIVPMAVFYCTIHFGKPLGECISSFFGGIVLGVVSYHTRSIRGGLLVHLGIAWLMEFAGWAFHLLD